MTLFVITWFFKSLLEKNMCSLKIQYDDILLRVQKHFTSIRQGKIHT